jgi:hypothetical protein
MAMVRDNEKWRTLIQEMIDETRPLRSVVTPKVEPKPVDTRDLVPGTLIGEPECEMFPNGEPIALKEVTIDGQKFFVDQKWNVYDAAENPMPKSIAKGKVLGAACGHPTCAPETVSTMWDRRREIFVCQGCADDQNRYVRAIQGLDAPPPCVEPSNRS